MNSTEAAVHFGLDRLAVRGDRVFGWGWVAADRGPVVAIDLDVRVDGTSHRLAATHGLMRDDVAQAFPTLSGARTSGFTVTGFVPCAGSAEFELDARFADGSCALLPAVPTDRLAAPQPQRQRGSIFRALARRLRTGDFSGIRQRLRDRAPFAGGVDSGALRRWAGQFAGSRCVMLFDHDMGGGANTYRRELIADLHAQRINVVLVTCQLPSLDFRLRMLPPAGDEAVFRLDHVLDAEKIIDALPDLAVIVNSPVSFDDPLLLAEWLARMRSDGRIRELIVTAHDHFAICPSFVLLDADGVYCGIPDIATCAQCLPRHRAPFMNLSPPTTIPEWRASWLRCLLAADEVRCFSMATQRMLLRAFPTLDPDRIAVRPHALPAVAKRRFRVARGDGPVIGIVGHISAYKGAGIVAEMVAAADAMNLAVRFVVFGTLEAEVRSSRLVVTGEYRREALHALIEQHGANVFAFPSICPETFSYVVEELMAMGVPLVAFDLGAQGEKVGAYSAGRVCTRVDARTMLETALAFHAEGNNQVEPAIAQELQ